MSSRLEMDADFEELEVGDAMTTRGRTITESDLVGFSAMTGDWHPQHADAEWAAGSQFGERIAHGMMVVSYAVGLVPFEPDRVIALRGLEKVTFKRPARMGDTIRVEVKVASKRQLDDEHGLVGFKWRILNQDGQAVVQLEVSALWRLGEAGGEGHAGGASGADGPAGETPASSGSQAREARGEDPEASPGHDQYGSRMVFL